MFITIRSPTGIELGSPLTGDVPAAVSKLGRVDVEAREPGLSVLGQDTGVSCHFTSRILKKKLKVKIKISSVSGNFFIPKNPRAKKILRWEPCRAFSEYIQWTNASTI